MAIAALGILLTDGVVESQPGGGQEARRSVAEYDVKAAFLLNFAKFVEWPHSDEARARTPFSICILGDDPFGGALDQVIQGETIEDRSLVVKRISKLREGCEVLFISSSERDIPSILKQAGPRVLTVGEGSDFLRKGGMISFLIEDRRVRFDVNLGAADRASLRISSRLLGVARTVL